MDWEKIYAKLEENGFSIRPSGVYVTGYYGQSFYRVMMCPESRITVCVFAATYDVAKKVWEAMCCSEFLVVPELVPETGVRDWSFSCQIKLEVAVRAR